MRSQDLPRLLHLAGEDVLEPDLARSTWERGRRSRRRRLALRGTGALGVLALAVSAFSLSWSEPGPLPAGPAANGGGGPVGAEAIELPLTSGAALPGEQAGSVWRVLYTACLEDLGYEVSMVPGDGGGGLAATRQGVQAGERDRDLQRCRTRLALDSPVTAAPAEAVRETPPQDGRRLPVESAGSGLDQPSRLQLTARYHEYLVADACLRDVGLPTSDPPPAEDFIEALVREQLPPWHPHLEAAEQGQYAQARTACPLAR
ncbi:hypothetical protein AVL62_08405 [Serinicoccus chungangensis]|uniref:Uncharacterized protein n=1 Tax=Serinicoccus chungangensis TaxID=767452 RepID=A0A0W8I2P9_9MICO|nr:hypothetical protein [Serinicoccus chungangensis]KUG51941.1 hypothetical protein AVL62_08405 [Serinicoccus chungangensis]